MAQLPEKILQVLSKKESLSTLQLAEDLAEDHQKVIGAVKSLQSVGDLIEAEQKSQTKIELTSEGESIAEKGSHEAIVFGAVPPGDDGVFQNDLLNMTGKACKIGLSKAIQNGWVKVIKYGSDTKIVRITDSIEDGVQQNLREIRDGKSSALPTTILSDLKKRKLLTQTPVTYYNVKKGKDFAMSVEKLETELTPEMLASGDWKKKKFKSYNFQALGTPPHSGHLHPLMKVRSEFRSILLEMGFSEMPTNRFVESSFWNFDALYVPQKHPARDAQDTFFMSQPEKCKSIPKDFMLRVRAAHTGQDYDTVGYGPVWKEEESYKNCLRTHTTAVSARMLEMIGSKSEFKPTKLFSIDRVYRNETLDATHLAEFHQVEGVVADYNLNLGNLIGVMKEFFGRLGITKLRFKPAYNPYTEPSMEVFSYHEGLKRWVEVGNSGMFRPEMLLPMGIPKDVRVIAWGLSLERPTMIRYGIDNIRDLVGPKVDLQMVYNNPICRLDKHFDIGNDGSYLDNPLMRSPKREKASSVVAPEEEKSTSKNKNRRRKKKNKTTDNSGKENLDSNLIVEGGSGGASSTTKDKPVSQATKPRSPKSQENQASLNSDNINTSKEGIPAVSLNVVKNQLQASESETGTSATPTATESNSTTKSSKKKKKSKKVKSEAS